MDSIEHSQEQSRITIALGILAFTLASVFILSEILKNPLISFLWLVLVGLSIALGFYIFLIAISLTPTTMAIPSLLKETAKTVAHAFYFAGCFAAYLSLIFFVFFLIQQNLIQIGFDFKDLIIGFLILLIISMLLLEKYYIKPNNKTPMKQE